MKEKKENTRFKKIRKIVLRTLLVLLLLLFTIGILLSLPVVQTKIAHYVTSEINEKYKTDINLEQVEITIFGDVQLKKILIKDSKKDTLIAAKRINTNILNVKKLLDGDLVFGTINADNLDLKIKTYKGERDSNLDKFIAAFDNGKPSSGKKFLMTSDKITLTNSRFLLIDENRSNPKDVDFTKLNSTITDFKILGPEVTMNINKMSFQDHHGLFVENLRSKFTYTKKNIRLEELELNTKESHFNGKVILKYDRKDFADFNNKVIFDIKSNSAQIASNDIYYFYNELGKGKAFSFKGSIYGTLNNFKATNLQLFDQKKSEIDGDVVFKNLFAKPGKGSFYMKGSFDKITSSYTDLVALLPNVLGKKLPSSLSNLGVFNLKGDAEITLNTIDTDFILDTKLGKVASKLFMSNLENIDNASYKGKIDLKNFDIGSFLGRKDVGKVSLSLSVDGKGFTEKYLDTKFSGKINNVIYNGYNFQNIIADGSFKKPFFKGKVNVNDPNALFDFDGIIDLSKKENVYDFHAKIDHINFNKLNFNKDSVSVFRGEIVTKLTGSTLNNLKGEIFLSNSSYQNKKDLYFFDSLQLNSSFDSNNERVVTLKSDDGIDGEIVGKYDINQVYKIVQNSLGSLYTNYKPNLVKGNQYLKFNFSDFHKIIEIISPDVTIAPSSVFYGSINSDKNDFKFNFESDSIKAFNIEFEKVNLEIDNKNPLYNSYVQIDSIKTKKYKVRDFSLINSKSKDTLNFRTEFKGGEKGKHYYNYNLYHTFNKDNNNVVGFSKSEMMFKDFMWYLNEQNDDGNKIVFDKNLKKFSFENLVVSNGDQSIKLNGFIEGENKNLELTFHEVNLNKITPDIDKFKFEGNVNGEVFLKQKNNVYQPSASLEISSLFVNDNEFGNLDLKIEGDTNFSKFKINSSIENENFESFNANGSLSIENNDTFLDLDLKFQKFNLGVLSNLGGEVITNIRGIASGNAVINGNVNNLDYNGRLFVENSGLTIPYLKVDYNILSNSIVDVTKEKFIIQRTRIIDSKYNTEGNLEGFIKHKQFGNWELDLNIDSNRLVVLDTKDHDDAAYYGTAFINGSAKISGPTNGLVIDVKAESQTGTDIKIPINDAQSVSENEYIHFVTPDEKYKTNKNKVVKQKNYNGLEMNFDIKITPVATIEVILDKDSGHGMKGSGEGGLLFRINTLGKFLMYGDFVIEKGSYNFKYAGLIDKTFEVKPNSSIVWDGDPFKAILDLEAIYKTQANPAVLIENASFNRKMDVEVRIGVKGTIKTPEPDFNIKFPTLSSVMKSEIQAKLDDKDARQTQALYLLSTGGFLSQDGLSQGQLTNNLFEKASVLFNDIINNDPESKLQLGFDYVQADNRPGYEADGRVGVTLSTKINDRLSINGKVGVPTGGISQTAVIGNFELLYRVNDDGTLNLRVFNKENDINFIGQGIGYTQGIGVNYEVDFNTFRELIDKIFSKKKLTIEKETNHTIDDSSHFPDFIHMNDKKEGKKNTEQKPNPNKEGIPEED